MSDADLPSTVRRTSSLCSPSMGGALCVTGLADSLSGLRNVGTCTPLP